MISKQPIKILIADTHYLIREGLRTLIAKNSRFEFLAEVTNSSQLHEALNNINPDVLIVDHCCDDCFSVEQIQKIKNAFAGIKILVISSEKTADEIKKIINIGIKNYLLKECDAHEITEAIEACARGEKYFCGQIIDVLLEKELSPQVHCESFSITEREQEIITLLVSGIRPKEIADKIHVSYHTVATHKKNIYKKLGISSIVELTQYASKTGIFK